MRSSLQKNIYTAPHLSLRGAGRDWQTLAMLLLLLLLLLLSLLLLVLLLLPLLLLLIGHSTLEAPKAPRGLINPLRAS